MKQKRWFNLISLSWSYGQHEQSHSICVSYAQVPPQINFKKRLEKFYKELKKWNYQKIPLESPETSSYLLPPTLNDPKQSNDPHVISVPNQQIYLLAY